MTRPRIRHLTVAGLTATALAVAPASAAVADNDRAPAATPGMAQMMNRMSQLMADGNPGMAQMHA